jgi:hypothetical protein
MPTGADPFWIYRFSACGTEIAFSTAARLASFYSFIDALPFNSPWYLVISL